MYQIQGKYLWGGEGWPGYEVITQGLEGEDVITEVITADAEIAEGGLTATAVLGAVAVAISAVNIAGGFAVTFRMLVRNHCPHPIAAYAHV